jgi:hypothetical protein
VIEVSEYTTDEPLYLVAKRFGTNAPLWNGPPPDAELTRLHRPMCTILSGLHKEHDKQLVQIISRVFVLMLTVVPKHDPKMWRKKIPNGYGGGPFFTASRTFVEKPNEVGAHSCVIVDGPCQTSKSPEAAAEAYSQFHLEGLLPIIFIRNRGGREVGSTDMKNAVVEMGEYVKKKILPRAITEVAGKNAVRHLTEKVERLLIMQPRVASTTGSQDVIHFDENRCVEGPQVMIQCIHHKQVDLITKPLATTSTSGLQAVARKCNWIGSLLEMMSDNVVKMGSKRFQCRYPMYRPHVYEPANRPSNRETFRIALIFDEDDIIKSATGKGAIEKMMFGDGNGVIPAIMEALNAADEPEEVSDDGSGEVSGDESDAYLFGNAGSDDDSRDGDDARNARNARKEEDEEEEADDDEEEEAAYKALGVSLRSSVGSVIAYTATPSSEYYDVTTAEQRDRNARNNRGSNSENAAESREMVTTVHMVPSPHYVGYRTGNESNEPWREHFVQVRSGDDGMWDRAGSVATSATMAYSTLMKEMGHNITDDLEGFPHPFKIVVNGPTRYATIPKGRLDEYLDPPSQPTAAYRVMTGKDVVAKAKILRDVLSKRALSGMKQDEHNIKLMLEAMHVVTDGRQEPFRLGLIHSNYTAQTQSATAMGTAILSLPSVYCEGLLVVFFSCNSVACNWRNTDHDIEDFKTVVNNAKKRHKHDSAFCNFLDKIEFEKCHSESESESDDDDDDVYVDCMRSKVPNINYMLSVLRLYYEDKRGKSDGRYKQTMMVLSGPIIARGARLKDRGHQFYLTDMFYGFNQAENVKCSADAARAVQAVGRLCTMRTSFKTPSEGGEYYGDPILWISPSNWNFVKLALGSFNEVAEFAKQRLPGEAFEDAAKRLLITNSASARRYPALYTIFNPAGVKSNGVVFHNNWNHMKNAGERVANGVSVQHRVLRRSQPVTSQIDHEHREELRTETVNRAMDAVHNTYRGDRSDDDGAAPRDSEINSYRRVHGCRGATRMTTRKEPTEGESSRKELSEKKQKEHHRELIDAAVKSNYNPFYIFRANAYCAVSAQKVGSSTLIESASAKNTILRYIQHMFGDKNYVNSPTAPPLMQNLNDYPSQTSRWSCEYRRLEYIYQQAYATALPGVKGMHGWAPNTFLMIAHALAYLPGSEMQGMNLRKYVSGLKDGTHLCTPADVSHLVDNGDDAAGSSGGAGHQYEDCIRYRPQKRQRRGMA